MALHSGATEERDGDYFGPVVNRVARLMAIANGDQIILSAATASLLRGTLPTHMVLRDLGDHQLRDLVEPESVSQLVAPGLPDSFPALRSLGSFPNNLPRQLNQLIDRHQVVAEIATALKTHPLVTIVGSPGVGKTRSALQVGAELLDGSGDGVWFVELAALTDSALIAGTIGAALGIREQSGQPMLETVLSFLKRRRLLLIVDNCEHLIDESARIIEAIAQSCPQVRVLATSREPLLVHGEQVYRMPSLAVPASNSLTAADALRYGAVALFAQRAAASDGKFQLTDENAPIVVEVCRQLDGIALAIELAAARVKVLAPRQLAQKLDERFRVLTGGSRTALPRQQTMRALIDWSYDLLSAAEQTLFRRLSIFVGDWTLFSAEAVASDEKLDAFDIDDLLSSLVEKSLIVVDVVNDETRYRLLESMRSYAHEKMVQHGELAAIARAHACAFLKLAEEVDAAWEHTPDAEWKKMAEHELENWRAALQWSFGTSGDCRLGQRLAAALRPVWFTMAPSEGRNWIQVSLETVNSSTLADTSAKLAISDAHLAMLAQQYEAALPQAEHALELFTQLNDRRGIALANMFAGAAWGLQGETTEGITLLQTALREFRTLGSPRAVGATLNYLGVLQLSSGDLSGARAYFDEALLLLQAVGASRPAAHLALYLAAAALQDSNGSEAVR
ncbi:MAG: AAA family ATPase, partial [Candidatus Eremiobacteraeota bacterium]|nr:AAA family ATPase [Candidatus Eremiobacteraeota bacterium]